jgi:hypothetical protein
MHLSLIVVPPLKLVYRDEVGPAPRQWVLDNVKGAHAICVSMSDKVCAIWTAGDGSGKGDLV